MTTINPGQQIENESFRIIREEMEPHSFSALEEPVVVRVIHATADFDFEDIMRFSPGAAEAGIAALRNGGDVISDVNMIKAGVSARLMEPFGGEKLCLIADEAVYARAKADNTTRAIASMRYLAALMDGSIIAIGNAPTALLEVMRLIREEGVRPALIIGMPVGFVSAVESKDELLTISEVPFITAVGRKGGSTVAVSVVNALLRLARQ